MKIFRYILIPIGLTLMSSHARSQTFNAYDLTTASAGAGYTGNQNYGGTLGMEFDVNSQAIKVTALGIFDSNGDGFHNVLTTYLFNRDTHALIASQDFSGTSTATAGTLVGYHRFIDQGAGILLGPGHYVIAAAKFSSADPEGNESIGGFVSDTFNSGGGLISAVSPSLYAELYLGPGAYPSSTFGSALAWNAGSFQYSLYVPEPSSVALMCSLAGVGGSMVLRRSRRRGPKKQV